MSAAAMLEAEQTIDLLKKSVTDLKVDRERDELNAKIEQNVWKAEVKHWKDLYFEFKLNLKEANAELDVLRNKISTLEEKERNSEERAK